MPTSPCDVLLAEYTHVADPQRSLVEVRFKLLAFIPKAGGHPVEVLRSGDCHDPPSPGKIQSARVGQRMPDRESERPCTVGGIGGELGRPERCPGDPGMAGGRQ